MVVSWESSKKASDAARNHPSRDEEKPALATIERRGDVTLFHG